MIYYIYYIGLCLSSTWLTISTYPPRQQSIKRPGAYVQRNASASFTSLSLVSQQECRIYYRRKCHGHLPSSFDHLQAKALCMWQSLSSSALVSTKHTGRTAYIQRMHHPIQSDQQCIVALEAHFSRPRSLGNPSPQHTSRICPRTSVAESALRGRMSQYHCHAYLYAHS